MSTMHDGHSAWIQYAALSADGTRVVYESAGSLATAKTDGTDFRIVAAPAGRQIVFRSPSWR
jgi:hypothetical protein